MNRTKPAVVFALVALVITGCATHRIAPPEKEAVALEYLAPYLAVQSSGTSVTISRADVYREGQGFVVTGKVRRLHEIKLSGHVDLSVCSADGTPLSQKTTQVSGLNSNRRGYLELPFRFRLDFVPPDGARMTLKYHAPAADDGEHLTCT
jgi:hypothetical protein